MRWMKTGTAAAMAFALATAGCGKNHSGNSLASGLGQSGTSSLRSAQQLALSSDVECENPTQCSDAVGMLVFINSTGSIQACTASLVESGMVMTNSHCIPSDLKTEQTDCQNRIWMFLPATSRFQAETLNCLQIVSATSIYPNVSLGTDLAFIAMTNTSRHPLAISGEGLPNELPLQLQKVDPILTERGYHGKVRVQTCKVAYSTAAFPELHNPKDSIMALEGCQSGSGNSGSPLLDNTGSARAVLQAIHQPRLYSFDDDDGIQQIPIASNLACLLAPIDSPCMSYPDGNARVTQTVAQSQEQMGEMVEEATESAYRSWAATTQMPLRFTRTIDISPNNQPSARIIFRPKCFLSRWKWLSRGDQEELTVPTSLLSEIHIEYGLDDTHQFSHRDDVQTEMVNFTFNPKQLLTSGSSPYSAVGTDSKFMLSGTLPACDPQR